MHEEEEAAELVAVLEGSADPLHVTDGEFQGDRTCCVTVLFQ